MIHYLSLSQRIFLCNFEAKNVMEMLKSFARTMATLDSSPAAITGKDIITGMPGHVPLMNPMLVPIGVTMYLVLKPVLKTICKSMKTNGKSLPFRVIALVHNILLCIYSFWAASNVIPMAMRHLTRNGSDSLYCGHGLWDEGLGYFGFLFYLSKYWELLDTALLIWKQKTPSFLQVYHHAVTIICGYMLQVSHSSVTFLFVGMNGTVHTVMYAYYAMTVLGFRFGAKNLITTMQLIQFVIGIILALPIFWLQEGTCATEAQRIAVGSIIVHAAILTFLFGQFYIREYVRKTKVAVKKVA